MTVVRSIVAMLGWAVLAGVAHAADPMKVAKGDLEQLLPGKTLSYRNVNGVGAVVYFEPGGRATYRTGNAREATGTWTVEGDGRYCIKITSGRTQDHCRHVWKTDSGYATGNGKGEDLQPLSGLD
ncbi:DUF995 domain-containing protein [Piscinibacter koreensis]|uniref:DUF995 domain-containing protein n=1 Tax=Piscinibacter koreensis TaxID=2742824 RepID=A0A7Y6NMD1_9BURK|nr:DUF995 domain-containing protein [Schlegelella koreensis]NUZ05784.1 DUF995 domain-containing protein [Schlegelella koreensis]